jgi:predicted nucleotidyltransferase
MSLAPFVPSIAPEIRTEIDRQLRRIEQEFDVRILFAIESGSRAWGFPSPDSDYDVRFVYAHSADWYLSLKPGRDVIELPIEGDWDINGWDIRKALNLLMKPNPVLLEWLSSPIRYRWSDGECRRLAELAGRSTFGDACMHHYRNLARSQWQKHISDGSGVNYKKFFYILRPALALHWIRVRPETPPPMNLQDLVGGLSLGDELVSEIDCLLMLKSKAKETGAGDRVAPIDTYIHEQIEWAGGTKASAASESLEAEAGQLFRTIVRGDSA